MDEEEEWGEESSNKTGSTAPDYCVITGLTICMLSVCQHYRDESWRIVHMLLWNITHDLFNPHWNILNSGDALLTQIAKFTRPTWGQHGANMGPTWVLSAPDGPHVGPMNLAISKWRLLNDGQVVQASMYDVCSYYGPSSSDATLWITWIWWERYWNQTRQNKTKPVWIFYGMCVTQIHG